MNIKSNLQSPKIFASNITFVDSGKRIDVSKNTSACFLKQMLFFYVTIMTVLVTAGCQRHLMQTPNLYSKDNPYPHATVPVESQHPYADVIYATDRSKEIDSQGNLAYGFKRSRSLAFGTTRVAFGNNLSWEQLVDHSSAKHIIKSVPVSIENINECGRLPESVVQYINSDGARVFEPDFIDEQEREKEILRTIVEEKLAIANRKEVYIFIHGFNNTFADAAFVAAELWHFSGRVGVPMIYTWPSGTPGLFGYFHDRESGEFTIFHLKQFLRLLAKIESLEKIHVIAHSRGTDVITTALRELHLEYKCSTDDTGKALKLGHLILAAPDLDFEVVSQRISSENLVKVPESFTIYISPDDLAIAFSNFIFGSIKRLGTLDFNLLSSKEKQGIIDVENLTFINVAAADTGFLGHSYFYNNPAVSSDLILLLRDGKKAGEEHGRPLTHQQDYFWKLSNKYPN